MISPSFALTATERVLPRMALDFTTATLDSRVTFTRTGNTATVTDSSGVIAAINADLPRFDFNPTTLICNGLLIEDARTNLLLNSLIDGTSLATQLVTTTAVAHTLSFYGTGQIVLTGTSSATVVGTGAYPSRRTLTFTPTVGALTLTVTGTVQYAQLEVGAFATSFIPTAASQVTRTGDVAVMTGSNFSSWYNASEGAFAFVFQRSSSITSVTGIGGVSDGTTLERMRFYYNNATQTRFDVTDGTVQATISTSMSSGAVTKMTAAYKLDSFVASANGGAVGTDTLGTLPTVNQFLIGGLPPTGTQLCGWIQKIMYWPQRIINAEVQAFAKG